MTVFALEAKGTFKKWVKTKEEIPLSLSQAKQMYLAHHLEAVQNDLWCIAALNAYTCWCWMQIYCNMNQNVMFENITRFFFFFFFCYLHCHFFKIRLCHFSSGHFFFLVSFLTVTNSGTVQSELAPCPANINKSSDYYECILALSSVGKKSLVNTPGKVHRRSTVATYTPGLTLWVIVTKNLIHTAPCEPLCLES